MAEISNLKLKLTAVEKDRLDYEDRFRDTEVSDALSLALYTDTYTHTHPWRKKWQPTPVFLPGEFHGQRSLVGYSPWGCKGLDMTEAT